MLAYGAGEELGLVVRGGRRAGGHVGCLPMFRLER